MWLNWIFSRIHPHIQTLTRPQTHTTTKNTRLKGMLGEQTARRHLKKKGYKIIDVNFHVRGGEIDIIAKEKKRLVFVEVKASSSNGFEDPLAWIPSWKQKRIVRASAIYLQRNGISGTEIRFDVVAINTNGEISHIKDAFRPSDRFFM